VATTKRKPMTVRQVALKHGFRSGLEETIAKKLSADKIPFEYEKLKINFNQPEKKRSYTPDFQLLSNGIIIESKGRFLVADRLKHLWVKEQHPELDIRFVFTNSRSKLRKGAKSSYGQWCDKYGFRYYDRIIPEDWLKEKGKNKHPKFIKFTGAKVRRVK